jgi:hypothetical protein
MRIYASESTMMSPLPAFVNIFTCLHGTRSEARSAKTLEPSLNVDAGPIPTANPSGLTLVLICETYANSVRYFTTEGTGSRFCLAYQHIYGLCCQELILANNHSGRSHPYSHWEILNILHIKNCKY